jgi:peptidoglycan/LPS O-acetylase OafA/YrhL
MRGRLPKNVKIATIRGDSGVDSRDIQHRADIDGLRAVAVLSVVFFHMSKQGLAGGYLGVDIFFVLSGYLICAIIWREIRDGRFSVARFYDRRIRRIMPALLLVLLVTTLASVVLLLPSDLVGYSRSLLATLVFSANLYFWRDTNYFSQAAQQKPLLHIWSLGVEEQFYVLFPIILVLLARWWPRRALSALVTLTIASLAANIFAVFVGGGVSAFFMLPTRAWELGLGAVLALLPHHAAQRGAAAEWIAWIGALSIAIGLILPFESYWYVPVATPAVIGTALLILAGQHHRPLANRMLEWRPLVFLGLISYSLYLWHWPIIVFGQYYLVRAFTFSEAIAALILMAACAVASWRFVERPFRNKEMPIRGVRFSAGFAAGFLAIMAAVLLGTRGLPSRLNAEASTINQAVDTNYRCPLSNYLTFGRSHACAMNLPSRNPMDADVILLGNSHAQMYEPVWASILQARGQTGLLIPVSGCLPTVLVNVTQGCIQIAEGNLVEVERLARARTVVVGLNWWHGVNDLVDPSGRTVDNANDHAFAGAMDNLIDRLSHAGKRVVLIGPVAEPGWDVASILSRQLAFGHPIERPTFLPVSDFERRFEPLIHHFEARSDIDFARPDRVQCPADRCYYVLGGRSLFSDSNHIATAELSRFRPVFEAALSQKR